MAYFRFLWKSHRWFFIFSMAVIAIFQFVNLRMATTIDYSSIMDVLAEKLPKGLQKLMSGHMIAMRTIEGSIAMAFNHPWFNILLAICAISIPSRHIAGEIESGTLELLLSLPVERTRLFINLCISTVIFMSLIVLCSLSGALLSIAIHFELPLGLFVKMIQISLNLLLLFAVIMSITVLLSCYSREGSKVAIKSVGILIFFVLMDILPAAVSMFEFIRPFNILTYFRPGKVMRGEGHFLLSVIVLSSITLVCLALSYRKFKHRDIPG